MLAGNAQKARCDMHATSAHLRRCAYLEETQQLDVRGVRVRLCHVRQQRLLGVGGRDLRELQAGSAAAMGAQCVQQL